MANNKNSNGTALTYSNFQEHSAYKWIVLANVMLGTFMAVLDITIVNVGLPKMMAAFGTSVDKIEWVLTGYLLVFAVILPSSGWIADHLGYKKTYNLGLFLFTAGSLLCSLSANENMLIDQGGFEAHRGPASMPQDQRGDRYCDRPRA